MKSQPVEFLESIEDDLVYAYEYYDSWHPECRDYFRGQWLETVSWIEWNPELFPKKHRLFRRALIRNTYFAAIFAIEPGVTTVVAVLDMRRAPTAIKRLLKERKRTGQQGAPANPDKRAMRPERSSTTERSQSGG